MKLTHSMDGRNASRAVRAARGLQFKWLLFNMVLLAYTTFLIVVVLQLRQTPIDQIDAYQQIQRSEEALIKADLAAFQVVTALFVDLEEEDMDAIVRYFTMLGQRYAELESLFPDKAASFKSLVELMPRVLAEPTRENLSLIHQKITASKYELDSLMEFNRQETDALINDIRHRNDLVVNMMLLLALTGLFLLGTTSGVFFVRLTGDIRRLHRRVVAVVSGDRSTALHTRRQDEIGQLINGVNHMAKTLGDQERELELKRRKSSYQEKMDAIEALAGGIAHEINNPINCIEGLAVLLQEKGRTSHLPADMLKTIDEIVTYSTGLTRIMRDLQAIATPSGDQFQFIDLNQLVSNIGGLLQFSTNRSGVPLDLKLDRQIPAVYGIEDELALVVSNVLENAVDALEPNSEQDPEIVVETGVLDERRLFLRIADNGHGMDDDTLAHIFEPFFSTKAVGHGTGLGLALCRSTLTAHGGGMQISSQLGVGTTVEITLPANLAAQAGVGDV